jgi:hypothetical protein
MKLRCQFMILICFKLLIQSHILNVNNALINLILRFFDWLSDEANLIHYILIKHVELLYESLGVIVLQFSCFFFFYLLKGIDKAFRILLDTANQTLNLLVSWLNLFLSNHINSLQLLLIRFNPALQLIKKTCLAEILSALKGWSGGRNAIETFRRAWLQRHLGGSPIMSFVCILLLVI